MTLGFAGLVALAFLVGAICGGAAAWHVRGPRADASASPHSTLRVVAITALLTLVVVAGGAYLAIRVLFRSEPVDRASTDQALADFRRASSADRERPAPEAATPAAGVYTYRASGFFRTSVTLLGTEHRDLPETVPALLVADGNCWDLAVRYFEQHRWTTRFCREPGGALRVPGSRTENVQFGREMTATTTCRPDVVWRPDMKAGDTVTLTCDSENDTPIRGPTGMEVVWTFVGVEKISIGNKALDAYHLLREVDLAGRQAGSARRDVWYAASGLLVQLRNHTKSSGIVDVQQDYELTLTALAPED